MIQTPQSLKPLEYKTGEIVRYTGYEDDLINDPYHKPSPAKYFKIKKADTLWGIVDYGQDTIGLAYITKTNFIERIKWWLFWR